MAGTVSLSLRPSVIPYYYYYYVLLFLVQHRAATRFLQRLRSFATTFSSFHVSLEFLISISSYLFHDTLVFLVDMVRRTVFLEYDQSNFIYALLFHLQMGADNITPWLSSGLLLLSVGLQSFTQYAGKDLICDREKAYTPIICTYRGVSLFQDTKH